MRVDPQKGTFTERHLGDDLRRVRSVSRIVSHLGCFGGLLGAKTGHFPKSALSIASERPENRRFLAAGLGLRMVAAPR